MSSRAVTAAFALLLLSCHRDSSPSADESAADTGGTHATAAQPGGEWNSAQIDWQPYEAGLSRAKSTNTPVCLVISAGWCPHCKNYSHVFDDPRIVERAKHLVMIRIDSDKDFEAARKYVRDGSYVPRTFFLSPSGAPDYSIHAPRPQYAFFYDERDPASVLAGMTDAIAKLR